MFLFFFLCRKTKKNKQKSKYISCIQQQLQTLSGTLSVQVAPTEQPASLTHVYMFTQIIMCPAYAAPGAGEGTSSGGDPTHPPRKKRARVDPTVESVSPRPQ